MSGKSAPACIAVMGATSTGKSRVAVALSLALDGEVISMDSRQVYRGMPVGTAQVPPAERAGVPHHLMGHVDPTQVWSAGKHVRAAREASVEICSRGRVPVFVGGTGMYFRALFEGVVDVQIPAGRQREIRAEFREEPTEKLYRRLEGLDPVRAAQVSATDRVRVCRALELIEWTGKPVTKLFADSNRAGLDARVLRVVLTLPRPVLRRRIEERTREMFANGWVEEVQGLLGRGIDDTSPGMQSLGYRDVARVVRGDADLAEAQARIVTATRQYAKRQETFFRGDRGAWWVDASDERSRHDVTREALAWCRTIAT